MTTILERLADSRVIEVHASGQHITITEALDFYAHIDLTPDEVDQLADELRAIALEVRTAPPQEIKSAEEGLSPHTSGQAELSGSHSADPSGIIENRRTDMSNYDPNEWELVGGIYRRKKKKSNFWGWVVLAGIVVMLLPHCH